MDYKITCGIETHVELSTKTKIFCGCTTAFSGLPNTHCCPVCTGQPGALPVLNRRVVEYAVRAGLALHCNINRECHMDRKNYFYPDLPKAYQISQFDEPVCENGFLELESGKKIRIKRIHIEEDAGKLIHEKGRTLIDYNRSGVPLIEIVSEPDLESAEEAKEYAEKLRLIMKYIGVSDCKMQEGSVRFDVNVSLRREGDGLGVKTEMKNLGSISGLGRAINAEYRRQREIFDRGGQPVQATLRYDAAEDSVSVMRIKENADDYRYFPEPDILSFSISETAIENAAAQMPELPSARVRRYISQEGLPQKTAELLCRYRSASDFFEKTVRCGASAKNTANLIIKGLFSLMPSEEEKESFKTSAAPEETAGLVKLVDGGRIKFNKAAEIIGHMHKSGQPLSRYLKEEDTKALTTQELEAFCVEAISENQKAAQDVKDGKLKAINVLFGSIMKKSRGKADIKEAEKTLLSILKNGEI